MRIILSLESNAIISLTTHNPSFFGINKDIKSLNTEADSNNIEIFLEGENIQIEHDPDRIRQALQI